MLNRFCITNEKGKVIFSLINKDFKWYLNGQVGNTSWCMHDLEVNNYADALNKATAKFKECATKHLAYLENEKDKIANVLSDCKALETKIANSYHIYKNAVKAYCTLIYPNENESTIEKIAEIITPLITDKIEASDEVNKMDALINAVNNMFWYNVNVHFNTHRERIGFYNNILEALNHVKKELSEEIFNNESHAISISKQFIPAPDFYKNEGQILFIDKNGMESIDDANCVSTVEMALIQEWLKSL